ncbi:MAG: hypothetical protein LBD36_00665 [Holosporales bacterium]|nr:hypothetical protein [Holosporales bacterium]
MGEFEDICEKLGLPLYVLPPRRPDYNGGVGARQSYVSGGILREGFAGE